MELASFEVYRLPAADELPSVNEIRRVVKHVSDVITRNTRPRDKCSSTQDIFHGCDRVPNALKNDGQYNALFVFAYYFRVYSIPDDLFEPTIWALRMLHSSLQITQPIDLEENIRRFEITFRVSQLLTKPNIGPMHRLENKALTQTPVVYALYDCASMHGDLAEAKALLEKALEGYEAPGPCTIGNAPAVARAFGICINLITVLKKFGVEESARKDHEA